MSENISEGAANGEIKLSCRNLWKIYGPEPEGFFTDSGGAVADTSGHIEQIRSTGHIAAACDVSFDVREGEIFIIMGLSGSGKSTLVRCLSRLVEPTAGAVLFDGDDLLKVSKAELIDIRRHKMGMVFQNFGLMPHLTVLENVAFPRKIQGIGREQRFARAQEMLDLVGLEGREAAFPRQLSGGQQQRVGIARSLAVEPAVWFLDELSLPFISSAVETLEFCIPTGYLFRHAQDHQHAHLRLPRNRPWPRSASHRNPCPATAGSCPETEKAPAIASEGG